MNDDLKLELVETIKAAKEFIEAIQDYLPDTPDGVTQKIISRCEKAVASVA